MKILGTPVGTEAFQDATCAERIEEKSCGTPSIGSRTCSVSDQGAVICCAQCLQHGLQRTHKPTMRACNRPSLLGELPETRATIGGVLVGIIANAHGLGLRLAALLAAPAFWASWADALPMFQERSHPPNQNQLGVWGELQEASNVLDHCGFVGRPSWEELRQGARPGPNEAEPSEWPHGWQQHFASSASETPFQGDRCPVQAGSEPRRSPRRHWRGSAARQALRSGTHIVESCSWARGC